MAEVRRPFRFGFSTRGLASPVEWRALARRVEALGYSTLLVPDHVAHPLAPITLMATAAEATTTLRLGCHVFGNDFRHPVVLAKEAATLDVLAGGRSELGIGTGWQRDDYEKMGVPLDPPGVRVDRLAEALQVVKGCFADGPFSFAGAHYTVRDLDLRPKPTQRPRLPILVGGGGRRVLGLAAREADIVAINFRTTPEGGADSTDITVEATERKLGWVRAAAGERLAEIELAVFAFLVAVTDDDPRQAISRLMERRPAGERLDVDTALAAPAALVGSVDRIVETLLARRERFGISYVVVRDPTGDGSMADAFAPVVARLAGA
jgi:probable F420-dependent oxidoreductase